MPLPKVAVNTFLGLGFCAIMAGAYVAAHVVEADGRVKFCYTRYVSPADLPPVYQLFGHRDWRSDTLMATKNTYEEIVLAAQMHQCPLSTVTAPAATPVAAPPPAAPPPVRSGPPH